MKVENIFIINFTPNNFLSGEWALIKALSFRSKKKTQFSLKSDIMNVIDYLTLIEENKKSIR